MLYSAHYRYSIQVAEMNHRYLLALLAAILPGLSFGQDPGKYQCTYGDLQRRVEILYEAGLTVPCEVHYYKDTEAPDERQVLWRALNEAGYCERKAQEFIVKLQDDGWDCGPGADAEPQLEDDAADDAEPVQDDDTDALIPGEETGSSENL